MHTVGVRELANHVSSVLDTLEEDGQPVIVTRRGQPVAVLSAIDVEELYDHILAHAPEFVAERKAAEARFARGEFGQPLDEVIAELEAETSDQPDG